MACSHPEDELIGIYEGGTRRLEGRQLCALCGTTVYQSSSKQTNDGTDSFAGPGRPIQRRQVSDSASVNSGILKKRAIIATSR